jgi:hypothetical protein
MADVVTITIYEKTETGERFWVVLNDAFHPPLGKPSELIFVEPNVPIVVRQLYCVMVGRGAHQTTVSGASIIDNLKMGEGGHGDSESEDYINGLIESYEPNREYYQDYGPHLARKQNDAYFLGCYDSDSFTMTSDALVATPIVDLPAVWKNYEWIFNMLWYPENRPLALAHTYATRWRKRVVVKQRLRVLKRTDTIKQDLMAAAWHPVRMVDWCLDNEEHGELLRMAP